MQDDEATTLPNMLLGRYRVDGMLGEGGLGTVVKAFDTRLKRMVAIKTLKRASYAADPAQFRALEERFAREAEAGSRMGSHPNIVGVHDLIIDTERTQYLILEYLPGGNLAERIARGPLSSVDALRLTTEIARGLQAAHEMGLVHRDIKPANVFLTASEQAKIGDFGIAQIDDISGRTRATSGHPGTPLYMSPEQERQTAYLRPASDQYSLGLVTFEMATGQIYKRVGPRQAAQLLSAHTALLQALIAKMLADDPDDRYPAMADVVHALRAIERQVAGAETRIAPNAGNETLPSHNDENLAATRHDTPRVGLQPMPPVVAYAPALALPIAPRYSRRAVLIGAGGLALAAGTAGMAMTTLRKSGATIATATPLVATLAPVAATSPLIATSTVSATVTTVPVTTVLPVVITAPPIVITATPLPTVAATPTSLPTATPTLPPPTPTPLPPTATPAPVRQVQFVTWVDRQNRMQMAYPASWRVAPLTGQDQVFEIDSGDGVDFIVYVSNNVQNDNVISGITAYRDRQSKRTDRSYSFGAFTAGTLGGLPSQSINFTSTSRQNPSDVRTAEVDYAVNGGWIFAFEFFTQGGSWRHFDELQAMLRSISFGR